MIFPKLGLKATTRRISSISKQLFKSSKWKFSTYKKRKFGRWSENMSEYDWEKEKLSDRELSSHFQDIQFCSKLKIKTITCEACGLRLKVDTVLPGIQYCVCNPKHNLRKEDGWEPYVERKDILVWRKEHHQKKGLYHYKLYGKFDDVTVWEFLAVQLDLSKYRLGWDTSTASCLEVESQNFETMETNETNNTIVNGDSGITVASDNISRIRVA